WVRPPPHETREPIAMRIRQRTKQQGVDDAEDRRRRPDPEREREDGDRGEAGRAPQPPPRVADVLSQVVEPSEPTSIAVQVLQMRRAADRAASGEPGLVRRQPAPLVFVLEGGTMGRPFAIELLFGAISSEDVDAPSDESPHAIVRRARASARAIDAEAQASALRFV